MRRIGLMEAADFIIEGIIIVSGFIGMLALIEGNVSLTIIIMFSIYMVMFVHSRVLYIVTKFCENHNKKRTSPRLQ